MKDSVAQRIDTWLPLLALAALACAVLAQFAFTVMNNAGIAIALFIVALALWGIALMFSARPGDARVIELAHGVMPKRRVSATFAGSAIALALVTFFLSGDNAFTPDNVLAWMLSIALFLYSFWEPAKSWSEWRVAIERGIAGAFGKFQSGISIPWALVALGAILLIGAVSFYYRLDSVPLEMTSDHSEKILDVNTALKGERPIFFDLGPGREPIFIYLVAGLVAEGGQPLGFMALKMVTTFVSLLTVALAFLLTRELFDDEVLALIAAALVATSKWLMIVARIGFRAVFTAFFVALVFFFLMRALRHQRRNDFLMTGLMLGAGLYTYNAFRIVPFLVGIILIVWLLLEANVRRAELPRYLLNGLLLALIALIVFVPLLRYNADNPDALWHRVLTRMGTAERSYDANPLIIFADNVKNALLMFNVAGDQAWPNNLPYDPALDFVTGGIFVLGCATAVYRMVRRRESVYAYVFIAILIMLMPSALSIAFPGENPGFVRAVGAAPFVMMIAALPLAHLARWVVASPGKHTRATAFGVIFVILVLITFSNYRRYFVQYDATYRESASNSSEIAAAIRAFANSFGDTNHVWIMLYPHWVDTRNVAINLGELAWQDHTLANADAAATHADDPANKLFILHPSDQDNLTRLQEIFPDAQLRVYHSRAANHDFVLLYAPGTSAPSEPLGTQRFVR